jgi:outer membrane protein assembly factor BamB
LNLSARIEYTVVARSIDAEQIRATIGQSRHQRQLGIPMRIAIGSCAVVLSIAYFAVSATRSETPAPARWPQFHGPGGTGVAADGAKVPREFGPDRNVLWKTPLPRGHSSPCIWDDRIYLTGCEKESKNLETFCLDRSTGKILWRKAVIAQHQEPIHELNSPATSTPATDGEFVFVYFGMFGLACYDPDGTEVWKRSFPPMSGRFGSGQSPAVAGEFVLLNTGSGRFSYATTAFDRKSGKTVWEKPRASGFSSGLWSTPCIRPVEGGHEVLVAGGQRICAFNLADGSERWHISGLPAVSMNSPASADGLAVLTLSSPFGDAENVVQLPNFDDALKQFDKNGDGKIQFVEIPEDMTAFTRGRADRIGDWMPVRQFMKNYDQDHDGALNRDEWQALLARQAQMATGAVTTTYAIRLDGKGDVSETHVIWKQTKAAPEVPSPLLYQGRVYLVSEKGIVTCRDAKTGKELYRERLNTRGTCYSSPVAGDGVVLTASDGGTVVLLKAGDKFEPVFRAQFDEAILATPALVDGKIYLRTDRHAYAFGQ